MKQVRSTVGQRSTLSGAGNLYRRWTVAEEKIYNLKYALAFFPGKWTKEQLRTPPTEEEMAKILEQLPNWGGSDLVMLVSILEDAPAGEQGNRSYQIAGIDGRDGSDISIIERFKLWMLMANDLMESMELDEPRRAFAQQVFEQYMQLFMPEAWETRQKNIAKRPTT
jgi:hypothetical protein